jgi:hypothetical protein
VPLTEAEIMTHYRAGTLLPELQRPLDSRQQEALQGHLVSLHNAGHIDMLALATWPESGNLDRRYFFNIQQIYAEVIPRLDAPPLAMLEMVERLVMQGGNDGLATMPRVALCRWIAQVPARAQDIIVAAQSSPAIDREVLRAALVAWGDVASVRSFLAVTDARRQAAIAALGAIKPKDEEAGEATFTELLAVAAADPQEDMRFTSISATFSLLRHCEEQASKWVPRLVSAVTAAPSDTTRAALLHALWHQTDLFQTADATATLTLASTGEISSGGLIGTLAATLYGLLGGRYHNLAIDCVTELFSAEGKSLPLENLGSVEHRLATLDRKMLFALAVRWFTTGDPKLCEVISRLLGPLHEVPPFDTSLAGFGLTGTQMIVLCHKAVGYLLLSPLMASSFIVAAIRAGDTAVESDLTQLLLQGLLINYGNTVVAYLKAIAKTDISYKAVRQALKLYRTYQKGLDIDTPIKELLPSSHQRSLVRQRSYVEAREIHRNAERQSIFAGTVQRSTVLYGRKAITYAGGSDRPPISMEMKTIRTQIEMPRLQIVDPVGLDWLTRVFRTSKAK